MSRLLRTAVLAACALLAPGIHPYATAAEDYTSHHENVMGTSMELCVRADDAQAAAGAEAAALREIDRLTQVFSGYDPSSEFSRWQSGPKAPARVSPELFETLAASDRWRALSGGAFDPRVEILSRLWTRAAKDDRRPTSADLSRATAALSSPAWRLDSSSRTAERLADVPLSLNAIAKGYIVEKACAAALASGERVRGVLLNIGGDLRVAGEAPRAVGIVAPWDDSESSAPLTFVEVKDRAVATSGRTQRGFRVEGRWYSHILDPRTGLPAEGVACASVIAPSSADADSLATVLNVLPPAEGLKLARSLPGVECMIVAEDGSVSKTPGWAGYEKIPAGAEVEAGAVALASPVSPDRDPQPPGRGFGGGRGPMRKRFTPPPTGKPGKPVDPNPPETGWGSTHELAVNFEINQPERQGGRYRRPYVAVWVEDRDGKVVRNLVLWVSQGGSGPFQWLPDLRRWYKSDKERKKTDPTEMIFTIARPTRPPGKYSVVWNSRNDRNEPVPPGDYTVYVEAAREHGTYQSISKKVTIADRPFTEDLKGNVEIKSASLEFRRRSAKPDAAAAGGGSGGK
ncbi:MAG: DUF2271 domain-containing protein [Isosphaeraceae bacterium]